MNDWHAMWKEAEARVEALEEALRNLKVTEEMVEADVHAPLCQKCEDDDIYERSRENCRDCARIRLQAALQQGETT